jgi:hypothetical protein
MKPTKYLSRKAASEYLLSNWGLKRSLNYLAKLAVIGGGPPFRKAMRAPLYTDEDLDAWASDLIGPRVRSTSELSPPRCLTASRSNPNAHDPVLRGSVVRAGLNERDFDEIE